MQERHDRLLEDVKTRAEKDHKQYLETLQKKHQSEMARLTAKHEARVNELGNKMKRLHEKHEADKVAIHTKAGAYAEELKKLHEEEVSRRKKKHEEEMVSLENTAKVWFVPGFAAGNCEQSVFN